MMSKQLTEPMMTGALADTLRGGSSDEVTAFVEETAMTYTSAADTA